ncbi:MAG: nucleotidyltransferase domain-containing protein [Candidatus Hodarchaeaceae archaeon]|nr:nucleotidyltransferase domain-containing protein [Candidatus Hodarchaeaceae archaeon]
MIQTEFKDLVFEFAKRISGIPEVRSLILFGSVAEGEADPRSDVDFLVISDTQKPVSKELRRHVGEIGLNLEKEFGRGVSLVFTNKNFDGLDSQFIEEVFKEGLILYGKVPQVDAKRLKLEPCSLVHFSLKKIGKPDKMRLKRALYGHRTVKRYGGKTYKSEVAGLIEKLGGRRTGIASVLVPAKNLKELTDALQRFGAEYEKLDVWVSQV